MASGRPVVILMTSNGVGMGHLSRQVTTALSGPHHFDTVMFSLSRALPRVMRASEHGGLPGAAERDLRFEYGPSWESGWLPAGWRAPVRRRWRSYRWDPYLRDRLVALATETGAQALVFDGVAPYPGLVQARAELPGTKFAWVRRGLWRPSAPAERLDASRHFDLTLEPGDVAAHADRGPTRGRSDAVRIPGAVSLTDVLPALSRHEAREVLGLPQDRPVLLLAPGSGALGSVDATAAAVLETVAAAGDDWVIAVTRQSIARHTVAGDGDRVVALEDIYPLARYLAAFDGAVSAAGYNGVHELLTAEVPTLLVPSTSHATDDQEARAAGAAARGMALEVRTTLSEAVRDLLDERTRDRLRRQMSALEPATGGRAIAERVTALAADGAAPTGPPHHAKPGPAFPDLRTRAQPGSASELLFTDELDPGTLRGHRPVEHLLRGASPQYRAVRESIAPWLYRVR
ncbi:glycosyltransferase [Ruania alba]|uniref:Glycosyltransferase family 28 C-terminal domain-containing protein n=1 Tax=Ruania alba TaxID=648782 RepID=A0A1H5NAK9_9MICO|nr:glycosyltransferase [Ruania alba]SEE98595.1 Glycosyltransferase family 28 C-terminal domain-containing protein [Ruania alba]